MIIWATGNTTCETLFMCLVDAGQIDINYDFTTAGSLTMQQLPFYNVLASGDILLTEATMLATKLDNQFTGTYLAGYQVGVTQSAAINVLIKVLTNAQNTVLDLADLIDQDYTLSTLA